MTLVRRALDDFRANPFAHGAILMLPLIQFGLNYFVSVEAVLCIAIIYFTRLKIQALPTAVTVIAVSLSLLWASVFLPDAPMLPRELRLGVDLMLLFWLIAGSARHDVTRFNGNWALIMLLGLALLTFAQAIGGHKGISLYMPKKLYVNQDDGMLADAWVKQARDHGYDFSIRPTGFYSEPSYLGGVSLLLNFICLHTLEGRRRMVASVVAIAICAAAQTFYGAIANVAIAAAYHHRRIDKMFVITVAILALSLLALPLFAAEPGRIEKILSGQDVSTGLRVTQPFELLGYVLAHEPFGIPQTIAKDYFEHRNLIVRFEDVPFHNGALNLIFSYGWPGFIVLFLLLLATGSPICALFMVLLMCQNGASLDFDKLFMLTFAVQIARGSKAAHLARQQLAGVMRHGARVRSPSLSA
ncbi:hypothetical protein [Pararobbsia silviterrae]|uniref:O-antigen ligase domain-containing protein n=1 Tax=Pararobbsia silviterrae TaxID=1792498 RepID=A0A494YGG7_9BURK|nr:hypothetical protein [Pararobbsia silviterrae]RKP59127.1 hypothetical protein D7S86_04305 [Pararobbsia silviterrae]